MMKVEQLMTKSVQACRPNEPLSTAAAIMWQHDCGCVPIVGVWTCRVTDTVDGAERTMREKQVRRLPVVDSDNRLVGILSFHDIVSKATGRAAPISDVEVRDTMAAICTPRTRP